DAEALVLPREPGARLPVGAVAFRTRAVMAALPVALPAHDGWATALRAAMAGSTLVRPADAGEGAAIAARADAPVGAARRGPLGPRVPGRWMGARRTAWSRPSSAWPASAR